MLVWGPGEVVAVIAYMVGTRSSGVCVWLGAGWEVLGVSG